MTGSTASAGSINHASNSSGANGNASQQIGGNEWVATLMPTVVTGWNAFDVTNFIKNDLTAGYSWAAFSFDPNTSGDYSNRNAGFSFSSAEGGNAAYLRIVTGSVTNGDGDTNAVPEPMTMSLFGLGGVAMAFVRRRMI